MKPKSSPLKKVLLKPTISALVFLSVLIVGAIGIWGLSALESLKSTENENKLTATMWDAMLDYVDVELAGQISFDRNSLRKFGITKDFT